MNPKDEENPTKDFLIGCTANVLIGFLLVFIFAPMVLAHSQEHTGYGYTFTVCIFVVVEFVLLKIAFKKYRYIGIGLLASLIIPLLISGSCFGLFRF